MAKSPYNRKPLSQCLLEKTYILRPKEKLAYRLNIGNTEAMNNSDANNGKFKLFLVNNGDNGESGQILAKLRRVVAMREWENYETNATRQQTMLGQMTETVIFLQFLRKLLVILTWN